ncbi:MAG: tetratricopeptide repeat protein [Candidatus Riflebacteria bacterium]|nr:tetratricopeptide repeat protein [Candidatus Riflebacteria bacterium]
MFNTTELFADLSEAELEEIRRISKRVTCLRGEVLFKQGDFSRDFYLIETGQVEILVKDLIGDLKQVAILKNGDILGEMALFNKESGRSATARTLQNTSLIVIPGDSFEPLLKKKPEISFKLLGALSKRLRETTFKAMPGLPGAAGDLTMEGKVLTIASPRAKAGKTTFALTVANILSKELGKRTLFIDLDLTFADGTYFMGVYSIRSIVDLVNVVRSTPLTWPLLIKALNKTSDGLYTLPGTVNMVDGERLAGQDFVAILKECKKHFDYIVIDTESHITDPFLNALDMSDHMIFLVDAHDLYAMKSGARFFQSLGSLKLPDNQLSLIACDTDDSFDIAKMSSLFKFRVAGRLPKLQGFHPEYGQTAFHVDPKSEYCEFARAVLSQAFSLPVRPTQEKGFFSRFFSFGRGEAVSSTEALQQRAVAADPMIVDGHVTVLLKYVRNCLNSGNIAEAENRMNELIEFFRDSSQIYQMMGEVFIYKNDIARAIEAFRKSLSLDENNHFSMGRLAALGSDKALFQKAIALLEAKIAKNPAWPDLRCDLGGLLLAMGRAADAVEHFSNALNMNPMFPEAQMGLGEVYVELGQFKEAILILEGMKEKTARAYYLLGECNYCMGNYSAAYKAFQQVIAINPNFRDIAAKIQSLDQYFRKLKRLIEMHQDVTARFPHYPDLHFKTGVLLALTGSRRQAAREFEMAIEMNPKFEEARQKLAELEISGDISGSAEDLLESSGHEDGQTDFQFEFHVGDIVAAAIDPRLLENHSIRLRNIRTGKEFTFPLTSERLANAVTTVTAPEFGSVNGDDILFANLTESGTTEVLHAWPVSVRKTDDKKGWVAKVDFAAELPAILEKVRPVAPMRYFMVSCNRKSLWDGANTPVSEAAAELLNVRTRKVVRPTSDPEKADLLRFVFSADDEEEVVQAGDILRLRLLDAEEKEVGRFDFLITPEDVRAFSKTIGIDRSVSGSANQEKESTSSR